MSTLKVNQIKNKLLSLFEAHLELSDLSVADAEREQKILSRCLAAFAIYIQTGCSAKEAGSAVWDGGDDNGIDAAYYDPSDSSVILVQSKWINKGSGEPEAKELSTFVKGVRDIVEQDQTNFHNRLQGKLSDIILRAGVPGTSIQLVTVTTGSSTLARHGQAVIDSFLKELNGEDPEEIATFLMLGLSEVYSGLANDPSQGKVTLEATILDWSYVASPYPAYYGMVDGLQLKEWWSKHGKRLVTENIRHSLGSTEVNNQIKSTATSSPEHFWYFNNGITMVALEAAKAPLGAASHSAGIFAFKEASIVNGAQTISSIAKVEDDEKLGKVRVPFRVILLKTAPSGFGNEVTRTNNLQNRIESRDFVAQDPEQKRLRQEMSIEGIDYQFVRSEEANPTETTCELIEVTTALASASGDPNLAVQLKTGIGRFFNDLSKPPYKAVFNSSVSGARAFNVTVVNRRIESWIEQKKRACAKKSGVAWGTLVHGNRLLSASVFKKVDVKVLSEPISSFPSGLSKIDLDKFCHEAYERMVVIIEKEYSGKVLAVLFKNPSICKRVFELTGK